MQSITNTNPDPKRLDRSGISEFSPSVTQIQKIRTWKCKTENVKNDAPKLSFTFSVNIHTKLELILTFEFIFNSFLIHRFTLDKLKKRQRR